MAVEWYIQSYSEGKERPMPMPKIMSVLSAYKIKTSDTWIDIRLPEGDVTIYLDCLSDAVSHMMIARPFLSETLDRIIYELMQCGSCIFFAPDAKFPIVLNCEISKELPDGMLDTLGKPRRAEDFASFFRLLKEMYP